MKKIITSEIKQPAKSIWNMGKKRINYEKLTEENKEAFLNYTKTEKKTPKANDFWRNHYYVDINTNKKLEENNLDYIGVDEVLALLSEFKLAFSERELIRENDSFMIKTTNSEIVVKTKSVEAKNKLLVTLPVVRSENEYIIIVVYKYLKDKPKEEP